MTAGACVAARARIDPRKRHDREPVARLAEVGRGPVEFDHARAGLPVDHVGLEPLAVGEIAHENPLVGPQPDPFGEIGRDRQAALVIDPRRR